MLRKLPGTPQAQWSPPLSLPMVQVGGQAGRTPAMALHHMVGWERELPSKERRVTDLTASPGPAAREGNQKVLLQGQKAKWTIRTGDKS